MSHHDSTKLRFLQLLFDILTLLSVITKKSVYALSIILWVSGYWRQSTNCWRNSCQSFHLPWLVARQAHFAPTSPAHFSLVNTSPASHKVIVFPSNSWTFLSPFDVDLCFVEWKSPWLLDITLRMWEVQLRVTKAVCECVKMDSLNNILWCLWYSLPPVGYQNA